jgi:hypothetical protein
MNSRDVPQPRRRKATRRFPAPWRADKMPGGYCVRDANGQAMAFVYSRDGEAEARQAKVAHHGRGAPGRNEHRAAAGVAREGLGGSRRSSYPWYRRKAADLPGLVSSGRRRRVGAVPERIKVTVRASGAHLDVLTVQDAMRQVLDIFEMIEKMPGVEWKLINASTNSPFHVEGEAISLEPSVDVSVVARAQKQKLAKNMREITHGRPAIDPDFEVKVAKRLLSRNLNGVGSTEIDLELGEPITVTPAIAKRAIDALEQRPEPLFEISGAREEIGSIEGTLSDVGTHYNHPAVKIIEVRKKEPVWCRLSAELQPEFHDRASYMDVWQHHRVMVRGRIKYSEDGDIEYILANDIRRIDAREVSLESIRDPDFTGGLSVIEYLDRFRDGSLG